MCLVFIVQKTQPQEREIVGQLVAVSFGDTTCEICVVQDGAYKDFVVDTDLVAQQLARYGDISQLSTNDMEDIIVAKIPFPVRVHAVGSNVAHFELL